MSSSKLTIWLILVASVAAAGGLWLGQRHVGAAKPALQAALMYPEPRAVPDFALTRSDGTPYTQADLAGGWTLMFFGFTHCPDVCPTTLAVFRDVDKALPPASRGALRYTFVSVDPERDTPQRAGEYAHFFSPGIVATTGAKDQLDALTRAVGVVYLKTPTDGGYTIDHSASIVLLDPQGRLRGVFRPPLDAARIAADLSLLAGS